MTSPRVNILTPQAELFYRRLMSVVDDYGRYFANPTLLRAACYPFQIDRVKEDSISKHLAECIDARLIVPYTVAGTAYLQLLDTRQQIRAKSKFPQPPDSLISKCEADAKQMESGGQANALVVEVEDVVVPDRFAEFWNAYPKKGQKPQCLAKWKLKKLDPLADIIVAHVTAMAGSDAWQKSEGQYCPNPLTYLNQERWEQAFSMPPKRADGLAL